MLSNTAVPRYYGAFREEVRAGRIPVCEEIDLQMHRIDAKIEDPALWYDDAVVEGFIAYCEAELTLTDGSDLHLLDSFKLWAEDIFGWYYFVEQLVPVPNEDGSRVRYERRQALFNGMNAAKASKDKTRMVLNMIFETALDEGIIAKNPMKSRRLRITGRASEPTAEYSIEQMRYLVQHIPSVADETDRAYLALQALHPLRLEEVLGLKWEDVDREHMRLHICRAVTHPTRNMPEVKMPKTKASIRTIGLSRIALEFLGEGKPGEFIIGGEKPFSYTQVRRMCERIRRDTGFQDRITPIRFRTTVLTDIYDQTKDIKQAQAAAGHTTAAMTLKYYVKGRSGTHEAISAVERAYGIG